MKRVTITLIAIISIALSFTSCKYEEGPGISLRSKKARVAGSWKLDKTFTNGAEQTVSETEKNTTLELTKDGGLSIKANGSSITGSWDFGDKKETLEFKYNFFGNETVTKSKIIKLKNKDMWLEATDDNGDKILNYYAQ